MEEIKSNNINKLNALYSRILEQYGLESDVLKEMKVFEYVFYKNCEDIDTYEEYLQILLKNNNENNIMEIVIENFVDESVSSHDVPYANIKIYFNKDVLFIYRPNKCNRCPSYLSNKTIKKCNICNLDNVNLSRKELDAIVYPIRREIIKYLINNGFLHRGDLCFN